MRQMMLDMILELNALPRPSPDRQKVVNVRENFDGQQFSIYVGRPVSKLYRGSVFANPFKVGGTAPDGTRIVRGEAVNLYTRWLAGQYDVPELSAERLSIIEEFPLLRARFNAGLALGCWCYPLACHATSLVKMAELMDGLPVNAVPDFSKVLERIK